MSDQTNNTTLKASVKAVADGLIAGQSVPGVSARHARCARRNRAWRAALDCLDLTDLTRYFENAAESINRSALLGPLHAEFAGRTMALAAAAVIVSVIPTDDTGASPIVGQDGLSEANENLVYIVDENFMRLLSLEADALLEEATGISVAAAARRIRDDLRRQSQALWLAAGRGRRPMPPLHFGPHPLLWAQYQPLAWPGERIVVDSERLARRSLALLHPAISGIADPCLVHRAAATGANAYLGSDTMILLHEMLHAADQWSAEEWQDGDRGLTTTYTMGLAKVGVSVGDLRPNASPTYRSVEPGWNTLSEGAIAARTKIVAGRLDLTPPPETPLDEVNVHPYTDAMRVMEASFSADEIMALADDDDPRTTVRQRIVERLPKEHEWFLRYLDRDYATAATRIQDDFMKMGVAAYYLIAGEF